MDDRPRRDGDEPEPPHDPAAEVAVLGAALIDATTAARVGELLSAADFYLPQHRAIFAGMLVVRHAREPVDTVTVSTALERLGILDTAGGSQFVAALMAGAPNFAHAEHHAGTVRRLAERRRVIAFGGRVVRDAYAGDVEPANLARDLQGLEGGRPLEGRRLGAVDWEPARREWLIPEWLPSGTVTLFHGRGGAGKSALALMLACAVAGDGDRWPDGEHGLRVTGERAPVVMATFEDSADELERRRRALVRRGYEPADPERIGDRVHALDLADRGALWAVDRFGPLDSADASGLDRLAAYAAKHAARLVVIDPLYAAFGGSENDRAHVGAFLTRLRRMASDLQAAVLIVSHPPKGQAGGDRTAAEADPSGSSTWRDGVRAAWRLAPESGPGSDAKGDALTLTKSNYGRAHPAVEPVFLESPDWPLYRALNPRVAPASSGRAGANGDAADAGDDAAMLGVGGI